jgi:uncharacterized protein
MTTMPAPQNSNQTADSGLLEELRIGRIVAVTGGKAVVLMDGDEPFGIKKNGRAEIGSLLKVEGPTSISLALVSALSSPMPTHNPNEREMRIVEVEFIGEFTRKVDGTIEKFRRGVSNYPTLGDVVFRANRDELSLAYAANAEGAVRIGCIQQDTSIPAMIKVDEMLGKHVAILGTTGTGKSCTVALILRRILAANPNGHILLLDLHREYAQSFKGISEVISPDNMTLPFWLLNFDEATEILIGNQSDREIDVEILREIIPIAKARYLGNQKRDKSGGLRQRDVLVDNNIGVDTPMPYRTSDLIGVLDEYLGKLDLKGELAPYKRLKAKLEAISRDPRFSFMFGSLTVQDNMAQVLSRLFRIPVLGKPIAILELGGMPSEVINVVVSVLARLAFDLGVWSGGRIPITFVCEEAHRYVPSDTATGFEPTKRALSRIAREGRKYGVSLCMVTQRPADLDPTILSQCSTVFSLRLTNERDRAILQAGISDTAASLLEFMPTMGVGEAVCFGEGVALPTRIKFDLLQAHELPRSNTASFTRNWAVELPDEKFLGEVVSRWRAQTYNPDSADYVSGLPLAVNDATKSAPETLASAPAFHTQAELKLAQTGKPILVGLAANLEADSQNLNLGTPLSSVALNAAIKTLQPAATNPVIRPSLLRRDTAASIEGTNVSNTQESLANLIKQFRT